MAVAAGGLTKGLAVLDPSTSDDQTSITWHDPMYPYGLTRSSVMHYFEFSPFFDRNSNNMLARRRNLDPAEPGVLESIPPENPPRVEYVVELAQAPHLFVIRKQQRKEAAAQPLVLSYYYVLDKIVYQAPTLHAALSTRLRRCLWSLQEGFHRLKTDLDPLQLLLRDEQRRKRKLELLQQQEGVTGPGSAEAAATAAVAQEEAARPAVRGYSVEDERRWRKAANVIDSVLSQFPNPKMPPEYWSQQTQQQPQQQQPAPGGDAAKKQQKEQQKEQQQQQATVAAGTGAGGAAATTQPTPAAKQAAPGPGQGNAGGGGQPGVGPAKRARR